ncbi:MAG: hypothetical protein NTX82_00430 [Candidatus Parcubacteria bacterium]|nr:hypothetical protein [Candidatus Parcubacteria bacterium]
MDQLKRMEWIDRFVGLFCILVVVGFFGLVYISSITEDSELKVGQLVDISCTYVVNNGIRQLIWAWDNEN